MEAVSVPPSDNSDSPDTPHTVLQRLDQLQSHLRQLDAKVEANESTSTKLLQSVLDAVNAIGHRPPDNAIGHRSPAAAASPDDVGLPLVGVRTSKSPPQALPSIAATAQELANEIDAGAGVSGSSAGRPSSPHDGSSCESRGVDSQISSEAPQRTGAEVAAMVDANKFSLPQLPKMIIHPEGQMRTFWDMWTICLVLCAPRDPSALRDSASQLYALHPCAL